MRLIKEVHYAKEDISTTRPEFKLIRKEGTRDIRKSEPCTNKQ